MVSAAEQLASNLNLGAFSKAHDLKKRLLFTLAALVVYRIGTFIPMPGINPAAFWACSTCSRAARSSVWRFLR